MEINKNNPEKFTCWFKYVLQTYILLDKIIIIYLALTNNNITSFDLMPRKSNLCFYWTNNKLCF